MAQNVMETIIGTLVIVVAVTFFYSAYKTTEIAQFKGGYNLTAKFNRADGLNLGSDVKIGGIKIGKVTSQDIDNKSFQAVVTLNIQKDINLPSDTSAAIVSSGLIGEKYVNLTPGSDDSYLKNNSTIEYTQSSINFEDLLGKFIFNSTPQSATKEPQKQ